MDRGARVEGWHSECTLPAHVARLPMLFLNVSEDDTELHSHLKGQRASPATCT